MSSGPHHSVPLTQAQIAQQQQAAAIQFEMAKRRSRKPTDKNLPDNVDDCIVGDMAMRYRDLRDFERRLDATMTRKRLDIVDSVNRSVKVSISRAWWKQGGLNKCGSDGRRSESGSPIPPRTRSGKGTLSVPIPSTSATTRSPLFASRSREDYWTTTMT